MSNRILLYNVCRAALLGARGVIRRSDAHCLRGATSFGHFSLDNYLDNYNQAVGERVTEENRMTLLEQGNPCFMIQYDDGSAGYMILRLEDLKDGMIKRPILNALLGNPLSAGDIVVFDGERILRDPFSDQRLRETYEYLITTYA